MPQIPKVVLGHIPGIGWRERKISFLETRTNQLDAARGSLVAKLQNLKTALDQEQTTRAAASAAHVVETDTLRSEIEILRLKYEDAVAEHERFTRPSFTAKLANYREIFDITRSNNWRAWGPIAQATFKLRSYSLADSLGISTPEIYRVWNSLEDIEFNDIGVDRFVLKADGGHSGVAVMPLIRTTTGWRTLAGKEAAPGGRPSAQMLSRLEKGRGPYFAEEFLESSSDATIPEDIKVYTAYGQVLQVLVMSTAGLQVMNRKTFTRKYFGPDGNDLGPILPGANYGPDIPLPEGWNELLAAAEKISIASGIPFVRVDLYATSRGPVLGELSPGPGGKQMYTLEHDAVLGETWNQAEVRLHRDLARGRPPGTLFGKEPFTWRYPDSDQASHPSAWPRTVADAQQWFTPVSAGREAPKDA